MKKFFFILALLTVPTCVLAIPNRSLTNTPYQLRSPSTAISGPSNQMLSIPVPTLELGDTYLQTDTLLTFQWNGQAWQQVLVSLVYSPTITLTPTITPTPTPTFTPINTPAGTSPTWTPTKTITPTPTPTPTGSPTVVPTVTPQYFLFTVPGGAPYINGVTSGLSGNITAGSVTLHVNGGIIDGYN